MGNKLRNYEKMAAIAQSLEELCLCEFMHVIDKLSATNYISCYELGTNFGKAGGVAMQVFLHRSAEKYLNRLQPSDRDRFDAAFADLEKEPSKGDIGPYEGNPGVLRLRVGNYRALFKFVGNSILVTHIEARGQAYKKKTRTRRG